MSLTLEIPRPLDEELAADARREGISAEERATLLLYLASALLKEERPTPFQEAVKVFLAYNSLDADHVASVLEGLVRLCVEAQGEEKQLEGEAALPLQEAGPQADVKQMVALLKHWRNAVVHRGFGINADIIMSDAPPLSELLQRAGRSQRQTAGGGREVGPEEERDPSRVAHVKSIRGKYAHLGVTSDDLRGERRADEEISERGLRGRKP